MKNLIDTIFNPVIEWLSSISSALGNLSVPFSRALEIEDFIPYFGLLSPQWINFVETVIMLSVIYMIAYVVVAYKGLFIKFKDMVKWW